MNAETLLALAERCEKAEGPDRELDCLIFEAFNPGYTEKKRGSYYGEPTGAYFDYVADGVIDEVAHAPVYTASPDAAMTLVPEGHSWMLSVGGNAIAQVTDCTQGPCVEPPDYEAYAAIPALALCAAALRARAASAMSAGTAETAQQAQGRSPASAVAEGETPTPSPSHPGAPS